MSSAYRSSLRCLWLVLFVVWTAGSVTATRAETTESSGSGVVIGADGTILTAAHVIKECQDLTVRSSSSSSQGYLVARDDDVDLAVVRSEIRPPFATIRDEPVRAGDSVVALGYPYAGILAKAANLTTGTVSALAGLNDDPRFLQISAPVQPGNSGGPLLDASGHLIGIVDARLNDFKFAKDYGSIPQNVNFAINTPVIRTFLDRKGIPYKTARSEQQLSPADVGEIGRPFTIELECRGHNQNNDAGVRPAPEPAPTPAPAPAPEPAPTPPAPQVKVLPACDSPGVTNVLIRIGLNLGAVVFRVQGGQVSSTADMRFCRGVAWTSAVRWTNPAADQYWVQLTWYSGPQPYSSSPWSNQPLQPTQPYNGAPTVPRKPWERCWRWTPRGWVATC
jgi:S1-C subfamily serine protease